MEDILSAVREKKEDPKKRNDMPQSEIGRLKLVVMTIHLKLMYKFNTIPVKIQAGTFVETDELSLKFMCKCK